MAPEPPRVPATEGVKEGTGCGPGPGPAAPDADAADMAGCRPCAVRLGAERLQLPARVPPPPAAVSRDIMLPTTFCGCGCEGVRPAQVCDSNQDVAMSITT